MSLFSKLFIMFILGSFASSVAHQAHSMAWDLIVFFLMSLPAFYIANRWTR